MAARVGRPPKSIDSNEIARRHIIGESVTGIAQSLGVKSDRIKAALQQENVEIRRNLWGKNHPRWKGGRSVGKDGYVRITLPRDHPYRQMADCNGSIFEHRLVMALYLQRPLRSNETVHHVDGDRQHNSLTNLQLRISHHGQGARAICGDCGSRNVDWETL